MTAIITVEDLKPFAQIDALKAQAMIDDALAMAVMVAPCLGNDDLEPAKAAAAKAILRGAILRWDEAGTGALQSQTTGPFGQVIDTRQPRRAMFWPSEITQLQAICKGSSGAFSIDTVPNRRITHAQTCAVNFGANYCDCGADIAGRPIFTPEV